MIERLLCEAAVSTIGRAYSHLGQQSAYGPEAALTWGKKQLSMVGKSNIWFYGIMHSWCFILYPEVNSISIMIQKSNFPLEKRFFFLFHASTVVFLPAKMK